MSTLTNPSEDAGILLASYTWEDDSLKLAPFDTEKLSKLVLQKLDEITETTVGWKISDSIDETNPVNFQWITQPSYIACSTLYRANSKTDNLLDLRNNQ